MRTVECDKATEYLMKAIYGINRAIQHLQDAKSPQLIMDNLRKNRNAISNRIDDIHRRRGRFEGQ